jgi:hypothetical protein
VLAHGPRQLVSQVIQTLDRREEERPMKLILIIVGILLALVVGFLVYSVTQTFDNWPWTTTRVYREGEFLGFEVGESKRVIFEQVIRNQTTGLVVDLKIDEPGVNTYPAMYKGYPVKTEDFSRVAKIDTWYFGIEGCNCWGYLEFENSRLSEIIEHKYRGPTE